MSRDKKLIIGNWKMNLGVHESSLFLHTLAKQVKTHRNLEVIIAPTMLALQTLSLQVNHKQFKLAAQNFYWRDHGAYTGEVSATNLRGIVQYGLVGHSERRQYFGETNDLLAKKTDTVLANDLKPIFCIGETLQEREANTHFDIIKSQLVEGVFHLDATQFGKLVIAYEPVWAIGTGVTASSDQAQEIHAFIRKEIVAKYNQEVADATTILYGGSCNPKNAAELFAQADIDGGLIGGASLKSRDFTDIIKAFN